MVSSNSNEVNPGPLPKAKDLVVTPHMLDLIDLARAAKDTNTTSTVAFGLMSLVYQSSVQFADTPQGATVEIIVCHVSYRLSSIIV
jgi:methyl coenzyme M reductase alpha subunit